MNHTNDTIPLTGICGIDHCSSHGHCQSNGQCMCLIGYVGTTCDLVLSNMNGYIIWQCIIAAVGVILLLRLWWRMLSVCRYLYVTQSGSPKAQPHNPSNLKKNNHVIINNNNANTNNNNNGMSPPTSPTGGLPSPSVTSPKVQATSLPMLSIRVGSPIHGFETTTPSNPAGGAGGTGSHVHDYSADIKSHTNTRPHQQGTTRPFQLMQQQQKQQQRPTTLPSNDRHLVRVIVTDWRIQILSCGIMTTTAIVTTTCTPDDLLWGSIGLTFTSPPYLFSGFIAVRMLLIIHSKFDIKTRRILPYLDVGYIVASLLVLTTSVSGNTFISSSLSYGCVIVNSLD
jgi:hypothetical protein